MGKWGTPIVSAAYERLRGQYEAIAQANPVPVKR